MIDFDNGSLIQLGGLQPDQIGDILGSEFATIFVNEANENTWDVIELLFSRLNDISEDGAGNRITPRFIADLNPTSYSSLDKFSLLSKGFNLICAIRLASACFLPESGFCLRWKNL